MRGVVRAGARDHGRPVADLVQDGVEQAQLLVVGERRRLAGRARRRRARGSRRRPGGGRAAAARVEVDRAVVVERRHHRGEHAADLGSCGLELTRASGGRDHCRRRPAGADPPTAARARAGPRPGSAGPRGRTGRPAGRRPGRPSSRPVQRQRDRGLAGGVEDRRERAGRARRAGSPSIGSGAGVVVGPERRRRLGHRRRQQQVEAALVARRRSIRRDELVQADGRAGSGRGPRSRPSSASAQVSGSTSSAVNGRPITHPELVRASPPGPPPSGS